MATTTTNNGWTIPQSTDLVTNGATAIATLGNGIDTSTGKGLIAWVAYTPTWTNVTKGTGPTESYYYCQLGKIVMVRLSLTLGTGGSLTGGPTFTLPVTGKSANNSIPMGSAFYSDASPAQTYSGWATQLTTTTATTYIGGASGTYVTIAGVSGTVPMTWTTGDGLNIWFVYEAA